MLACIVIQNENFLYKHRLQKYMSKPNYQVLHLHKSPVWFAVWLKTQVLYIFMYKELSVRPYNWTTIGPL